MITYRDKNNPMYAGLPFMKIRGETPQFPCVAEVKFDGEFQYIIREESDVFLVNKREHGRIRTDMPATRINLPKHTVLIGELFYSNGKSFYDFARHKLTDDLNLAIFGVLRLEGEDVWKEWTYTDSRVWLENQDFYTERTVLTPRFVCSNSDELKDTFDRVTARGFEGVIAKRLLSRYCDGDSKEWLKKKYEQDLDLAILGYQSGTKRAKNLTLLVGYRTASGELKPITHCGGGLTMKHKEMLPQVMTPIGRDGDDILVKPEYVVKVKHNGFIYDEHGKLNSLRHPRVVSQGLIPWREDKTIDEVDTLD